MNEAETRYRERADAVHQDVAERRVADHGRNAHTLEALERRLDAVRDAHAHQFDRNVGPWPLRQALIDLAALCEEAAAELPTPNAGFRRLTAA